MSKPVIPIRKIRTIVIESLPMGYPKLGSVATLLDVSSRTLQRRLADNNLTYQQLVNQTRIAMACQRLADGNAHISEIAREIGYATPSGFSRAFQAWTGQSPRSFRKSIETSNP